MLACLSLATQEGDANRFFHKEWILAHKAQRRFLPVRFEECRLPASLPKALVAAIESRQREDLFPSYEDGLRRILRFLHAEKRTGVFSETFSCLGPDNAGWRLAPGESTLRTARARTAARSTPWLGSLPQSCCRKWPARPLTSISIYRGDRCCFATAVVFD